MTDPDRPLVTVLGAAGFIGCAVTRELAARPIRLRLVGRGEVPAPAGARAAVERRAADLTAPGAVAAAVAGSTAVVHLVAHIRGAAHWRVSEDDGGAERVNVGVVHDLVAALAAEDRRPAPVVLLAGAVSQVGTAAGSRVLGDETDRPASTYARQKLAAEHALLAAHAAGAVRGVALRLPTVYGRGTDPRERGVVATMMRRALAGEPLPLWNDGGVARDLLRVDDVARALTAALDHADALAGRYWLLGSGTAVPVGELFTRIADAVAAATGRPPVPVRRVVPEHADPADELGFVVGSTAFGDTTGWAPAVDLADGLRDAAAARCRARGLRPAPG